MSRLKLAWLSPVVQFPGKGIMDAWGEEVLRQGWTLTTPDEADVIVFGSDSQLVPGMADWFEAKPTICYFWGYAPERFAILPGDSMDFREHAQVQVSLMARCTRVLCPTPDVLAQAWSFGLWNASLCVPGVDLPTLDQAVAPYQHDRPYVVALGRLHPFKQVEHAIIACAMIEPTPPLFILGPGDVASYQALATRLGVPATFATPSDQEKVAYLKGAAALVHPSRYEGFGLPPLEALVHGVPAVVPGSPHNRWLLREGGIYYHDYEGYVLPLDLARQNTVTSLAQVLRDVLAAPQGARSVAAVGQQIVRREYTLEHATARFADHLTQVVKEHLGQRILPALQDPDKAKLRELYELDHRRNWDYKAERFDPTWERHWRAQHFVKALTDAKAERIVDVGSGAVYSTIFARAGLTVTALDIAEEALRQADEVATRWGVREQITFVQGLAQHLPFPDGAFDGAVLGEILEHVLDPDVCLAEAYRVVRPGGTLCLSTPCGAHHWDPLHVQEAGGGWDDATMGALLAPYQARGEVVRVDKVAEEGMDPSCYFVVLRRAHP